MVQILDRILLGSIFTVSKVIILILITLLKHTDYGDDMSTYSISVLVLLGSLYLQVGKLYL